ncbi:MAG: hypothetical protein SGJ27_04580 [Candidatus Melainabacteria bacterium]|nr:hypothetical protein [Candidatus Melainabacteria bacterium]
MKDEHIQKKLVELEAAIQQESKGDVVTPQKQRSGNPTKLKVTPETYDVPVLRSQAELNPLQKSDLHFFGGIASLMLGLFLLFNHVRVGSGYPTFWGWGGGDHIGFLMLPLLFGIGWIFYNSRSVWGWIISAASVCMLVFTIISGLRISFSPISMIDLIIMLIPFAFGAAYVLKGMGGPQGVSQTIRNQIEKKN